MFFFVYRVSGERGGRVTSDRKTGLTQKEKYGPVLVKRRGVSKECLKRNHEVYGLEKRVKAP